MARDVLHVVPQNDQWAVKYEGSDRADNFTTQKEAIEAAREKANDGDSIVIHRADGTIRGRLTYTEDSANGNTSSQRTSSTRTDRDREAVHTHDIMSVGKRVSWSAILAGCVTALAVYATLMALAVAIGVTTRDRIADMPEQAAIIAAVVTLISLLVSLFLGGLVASRTTVGEDKTESIIYGVLLWGALFAFSLLTTSALVSNMFLGFSNLAQTPQAQQAIEGAKEGANNPQAQGNQAPDAAPANGAKEAGKQAAQTVQQGTQEAMERLNPTAVAWLSFAAMLLSICAAIGGAVVGAGPELVVRQLRDRRRLFVARPSTPPAVGAEVKART